MYYIGNWEFKTKTQVLEFSRNIINSKIFKQRLTEDEMDFFLSLLGTNPRFFSKEAFDAEFISVVRDEFNGKCLEITRTNGTQQIFSYHKLIKELK